MDHCVYLQARLGIGEGYAVKTEGALNFDCSRTEKLKEECEASIKNMRVYMLVI